MSYTSYFRCHTPLYISIIFTETKANIVICYTSFIRYGSVLPQQKYLPKAFLSMSGLEFSERTSFILTYIHSFIQTFINTYLHTYTHICYALRDILLFLLLGYTPMRGTPKALIPLLDKKKIFDTFWPVRLTEILLHKEQRRRPIRALNMMKGILHLTESVIKYRFQNHVTRVPGVAIRNRNSLAFKPNIYYRF